MDYNLIGLLIVAGLALLVAQIVANRPTRWHPARLLLIAIGLRILGSTVRYEVLFRFYRGLGDAVRYYYEGLDLARTFGQAGVSAFSPGFWTAGQWWGTSFLLKTSALVLSFIGPTMRGEFLCFSLLAFLGLYAIAVAFRRSQPPERAIRYATWIWLWPSLWFWPSSVGKEALIIFAIGLTTLGFVGKGDRSTSWSTYLAGLGLAFCVRPHVAAALAMATVAAYWLGTWERFSFRRLAETTAAMVLALVAFSAMRTQFGIDRADLEGFREFVEFRAGQTLQGGSNIGAVPLAAGGPLLAFVNVWMRPFPWDVHNVTTAFAAIEIILFWWLLWRRRKGLRFALRHWRKDRLLRFALPLVVLYTLMVGLTFGNLGIIARQRAPMFPFMIMLLLAVPASAQNPGQGRAVEPGRPGPRPDS